MFAYVADANSTNKKEMLLFDSRNIKSQELFRLVFNKYENSAAVFAVKLILYNRQNKGGSM